MAFCVIPFTFRTYYVAVLRVCKRGAGVTGWGEGGGASQYASSHATMCYTVKYMRIELPVCGHYYGCLLCGWCRTTEAISTWHGTASGCWRDRTCACAAWGEPWWWRLDSQEVTCHGLRFWGRQKLTKRESFTRSKVRTTD